MTLKRQLSLFLFAVFVLVACGANTPLERLKRNLSQYPEYSIVLEDMKQEGNFFTKYYHRYKTVYGTKESESDTALTFHTDIADWQEIQENDYLELEPYLGMVVASKTADGKVTNDRYPPGYQYVGNPHYGHWRTNPSGGSFWEWYGKYAMMSTVFNMFNRPVYRNDWDSYYSYRRSGRPYFSDGSYYGRTGRMYGTDGKYTQTAKPNFYERRTARETARKTSFTEKVQSRVKRSNMSTVRSRSSSSRGGK